MKPIYKKVLVIAACAFVGFGSTSCSDYLDVVPDERVTEQDTYADRNAGFDYLYSCYGYLPNPSNTPYGLDLLTGDEVITAFEHETFAAFPKGNYSASNPVISYWNDLFKGIRQCYMFMEHVDQVPGLDDAERKDFKAQLKFLIAFYHYHLAKCYGPIILIKETPNVNMKVNEYPARSTYDESVKFICDLFDEAAKDLPAKRDNKNQHGLATSIAAKALKAKLLVYAASPLFNGNSKFYSNFVNKDGTQLMPLTYDANKWVKAKEAVKEAIDLAEANGHALYVNNEYRSGDNEYPKGINRRMRTMILDWQGKPNPEVIFADTRGDGYYDLQLKSVPKTSVDQGANGTAPTWAMLQRFYTKNGLPWDEDPEFKNQDKLEVLTIDEAHKEIGKVGKETIRFNLDREPRFYSWIGFQGGYYEVLNGDDKAYTDAMLDGRGRVVLDFTKRGFQGIADRSNNYSPTGYLNKKAVDPSMIMGKGGPNEVDYPWPIIRLADLYLLYAETAVETGDLTTAKTYLNKVRERAGIPTVETSWAMVPGAVLNQDKLRDIVRQERMIEFYLENQNFWDMRRWLLGEKYYNVKAQGMNIQATTVSDFAKLTTVVFERKFKSPTNYLLPIPIADVNRNGNLVNNPGY